ncbi:hypothetical protein GCM10023322_84120 [Rugosimonospora acidiphila]|uniref:Uncharacterized protein n=1 Tax=Rugosimonospora acidiphila TaxID=556531 RepID=A0ABP9ST33_9ACTN
MLTAAAPGALRARAAQLMRHLLDHPAIDLSGFGLALAAEPVRSHRAVAIVTDHGEALRALEAIALGRPDPITVTGSSRRSRRAVFVFPGQGSQWPGMATDLADHDPVFRHELRRCDRALSLVADWSLLDVLYGVPGAPTLDTADIVQPVLFAVMVGLAATWRARGVEPAAVVGHSLGEVAAACVTGALSHEDAMRVAALWSRAQATLAGRGEMVSVPLPADRVIELMNGRTGLDIAAYNAPSWTVVSGDAASALRLLDDLNADGIRARQIPVGLAAHSAHIEELRDRLMAELSPIRPAASTVPFESTVTDGLVDTATLDHHYWYRNLRSTVRFDQAVRRLIERDAGVFVEMSPHPVLTVAVQDTLSAAESDTPVLATLRRGENGVRGFLRALAGAFTAGVEVDWRRACPASGRVLPPLPAAPASDTTVAGAGLIPAAHPLLGAALDLAGDGGCVYTASLPVTGHAWLGDHTIHGRTVLPVGVLVELALHIGAELGLPHIAELTQSTPITCTDDAVELQLRVEPESDGSRRMAIFVRRRDVTATWIRHATVVLSVDPGAAAERADAAWPPTGAEPVGPAAYRDRLAELGIGLGAALNTVDAAWRRDGEMFAEVALPAHVGSAVGYGLHPVLTETALQPVALFPAAAEQTTGWLPATWRNVTLHLPGAAAARAQLVASGADTVTLRLTDASGRLVLTAGSVTLQPVSEADLDSTIECGGPTTGLVQRLAAMPAPRRLDHLCDLIAERAATMLGIDPIAVAADRTFTELGFDSLSALALRNLLSEATGLRLRTTLVFDFPTPATLANHLHDELLRDASGADDLQGELDRLEQALFAGASAGTERLRGRTLNRLRDLLARAERFDGMQLAPAAPAVAIDSASDDEIFELLDRELDLN